LNIAEHTPCKLRPESHLGAIADAAELPEAGVSYYDVPPEYGVREYRYTIVNDRTVLVDPCTRRIVEIVEYAHKKNTKDAAQVERRFLVRDRVIPILSA
jgi:Protein of unknown function (DUF1236)